ncbi:MAG: hypothetical protein KZQ95_01745 [Candidatus Thiodiazotropha sp. (ex Epidulcina cf. delphinae)]|nr:hypothetical protein [Candidatus Thiodiazotropha sp. (ex Epidulcina cf. delphinae)]
MSRTVTAKVATAISQDTTTPIYLVYLGYTPAIRLSTLGDVTWNGRLWSESGVQVTSLKKSQGGGMSASLRLPNHDNSYGALVLGHGVRDIPVDIYKIYGDAPYDAADAVHIFSGVAVSAPSIDDYVTLLLISSGAMTAQTPRIPLSAWLGNDMPVPGTRISWAGDVLVLESR